VYLSTKLAREGKFEAQAKDDGNHTMCFKALDKKKKVISFEFDLEERNFDEDDETRKESLDPLEDSMTNLNRRLEMVNRNIQFTQRRERVHRDLTEQTCETVVWYSALKLAVLFVISFA
jgi:hypothetical protein